MHTIYQQVGIRAKPEEVYRALVTVEGIAGWWSRHVDGTADSVGKEFGPTFDGMRMGLKVEELVPKRKVVWRCLVVDPQWEQTLIGFALRYDDKNQQTVVDFTHSGWREVTPLFALCSTKWGVFMLSLKQLLETGKGNPHPDDPKINHF